MTIRMLCIGIQTSNESECTTHDSFSVTPSISGSSGNHNKCRQSQLICLGVNLILSINDWRGHVRLLLKMSCADRRNQVYFRYLSALSSSLSSSTQYPQTVASIIRQLELLCNTNQGIDGCLSPSKINIWNICNHSPHWTL